jgi:hypothetical protein
MMSVIAQGGGAVAVTACGRQHRRRPRRRSSALLHIENQKSNDVDASEDAHPTSRRFAVLGGGGSLLAAAASLSGGVAYASDGAPLVGDCADCVGIVNELLNSCPEETEAGLALQGLALFFRLRYFAQQIAFN